jgi:hypothetical protein
MIVRPLFAVVVVLILAVPIGAADRLAMRVSPAVAFAPANLVVKTMVEANKENRSIEISAESDEFYRSSEIQLDGDKAPRTTLFRFPSLPGGSYVVRAVLRGAGGHTIAYSETNMNVVAGGSSGY